MLYFISSFVYMDPNIPVIIGIKMPRPEEIDQIQTELSAFSIKSRVAA